MASGQPVRSSQTGVVECNDNKKSPALLISGRGFDGRKPQWKEGTQAITLKAERCKYLYCVRRRK